MKPSVMLHRSKLHMSEKPILVGVSACLLGEKRRYNGGHKKSPLILETLCTTLNCVSLCPEYAIGLGVPRNPITLILEPQQQNVHAIMPENKDVTQQIQQYAQEIKTELASLSGYVLKSKSPSCGIHSTSLYTPEQKEIKKTDGIFTATLRKYFPDLPLCEESDLHNKENIALFIANVTQYHHNKCV